MGHRTILTGGRLVDPANGVDGVLDIEIEDGRVSAVGPALSTDGAATIVDVSGRVVMPGVIDTHTHLSGLNAVLRNGHRMMARVGVTTALDLAGEPDDLLDGMAQAGAGLNVAYLRPVVPNHTVTGSDPGLGELERFVVAARAGGALGVKCLGGHYPITPGAIGRTVRAAERLGAYVAIHAGSTEHGSDIEGMEEALDVAEGRPVHIAHVNSYCRGQRTGDPLEECRRALAALRASPRARSESYLSTFNGTGGSCEDGLPVSHVTRTCLQMGGFAPTEAGLSAAILAGWANVWSTAGGETRLISGEAGEREWREAGTNAGLSFAVNPPAAAIALAIAKEPDGRFMVDAISTDGGGIPRNTTVEQGLALVRFGALTLGEFVLKASTNGAAMLGLQHKGQLGIGADADITVLDPDRGRGVLSLVAGSVIMVDGVPVGRGATLLSSPEGEAALRERVRGAGGAIAVAMPFGGGRS